MDIFCSADKVMYSSISLQTRYGFSVR